MLCGATLGHIQVRQPTVVATYPEFLARKS